MTLPECLGKLEASDESGRGHSEWVARLRSARRRIWKARTPEAVGVLVSMKALAMGVIIVHMVASRV